MDFEFRNKKKNFCFPFVFSSLICIFARTNHPLPLNSPKERGKYP